jgi:Holliday junction resolvasome RuvABC DNA-binding subunit
MKVGNKVKIDWPGWDKGEIISIPSNTSDYYYVKDIDGNIGGFLANRLTVIASPSVARTAKRIVIQLGREQRYVTSDHVQKALLVLGYKATDLGNAAGTLFKDGNFVRTNQTVKSNRPSARGRRLPVWEYVGIR